MSALVPARRLPLLLAILATTTMTLQAKQPPGRPRRSTGAPVRPYAPPNNRTAERAEYDAARRQAHVEMSVLGCRGTIEDVQRLAAKVETVGRNAGLTVPDMTYMLNNTRLSACDVERNGPIPRFEKTLKAIVDGRRLDPCSYDPYADNRTVLDDPLYLQYDSPTNYGDNSAVHNFNEYILRGGEQKECFLDLIRSSLTGQPWTPRALETNTQDQRTQEQTAPSTARPRPGPPARRASPPR